VNRWVIAVLIWLGVDVLLGLVALPVIFTIFGPGLIGGWERRDVSYLLSVLIPGVLLMIVPGGIAGAAYLVVATALAKR